jgi:thiol-disulfide isomerase/thioredoxin
VGCNVADCKGPTGADGTERLAVGVLDPGLVGLGSSTNGVEQTDAEFAPTTESGIDVTNESGRLRAERLYEETPKRIQEKKGEYPRGIEIQEPTGFINAESVNLSQYLGEKVILIEFWTYGCYNCQNTHPHIQNYWREYEDDGLVVIGVHYPEFEYEENPDNIREYLEETNTTYPVVIDNEGGTWDAYDQRAWPSRYLIGVDGFVRYEHVGEGAYEETDRKIRELLAERDRVVNETDR